MPISASHWYYDQDNENKRIVIWIPNTDLVVHDDKERGVGGVPVDGEYLARETVIDWAQSSE